MHRILLNSLPGCPLSPSLQTSSEVLSIGRWLISEWKISAKLVHACQWKCTSSIWTIFQRIVDTFVAKRVSAFTKISVIWRKAIKPDVMPTFCPTTAGAWRGMWSLLSINGSPLRDHSSMISFLSSLQSSCYLLKIFCKPSWKNQSNIFNVVFHSPTNRLEFRIFSMC